MSKVAIGVPTAEFARQAIFYDHLNLIEKPEGSLLIMQHGQSPARGRNMIIETALANDCTHILFLDDDTIPPRDIITKLLTHDVDMVTGLYLMRNFPHQPIIFDHFELNGMASFYFPEDSQTEELIEIVGAGLGACLIKTDVFRKMEKPWITLGELEKDHWCDDLSFFYRAKKAGFKLYCDLSVRSGHMATVTIRPEFIEGKWRVTYDTAGAVRVNIPLPRPDVTPTV